ncbi:MAG: rRNA maturation RNase YbeY [Bacteroidales bacterium]|nr:rRNA maturation RNase YbeY [Bacteroidales bacterium]MDD4001182.1 rRNA maturation RNase YbeY [Bacteroidales bacterium]MDD4528602.1 rRNA maturation RNase YbeY [Bacteroidales bacterium]MDD4828968.1 rRNA maturation RNase YbeY [Bacteroidales bacterium]
MAISFNFVKTKDVISQKNKIKSWIKNVVEQKGKSIGDISYIFCDDEYLLEINKTYLEHDFFTDIITFDYSDKEKIAGDLFISIDRVRENSLTHNENFEKELHRVIIHGILHLLGLKDKTEKQAKQMRKAEEECLRSLML